MKATAPAPPFLPRAPAALAAVRFFGSDRLPRQSLAPPELAIAISLAAAILVLTAAGYGGLATVAGYVAIVVAAIAPPIGLAVLVLHAPEREPTAFASLGFHFVLAISVLVGCLVRLRSETHWVRFDALSTILLTFGAFAFIQVLATPQDPLGEQANSATLQLLGLAAGGALLFAARHLLGTRDWRPFLDCAILSAVVAGGLAIASFATNGALQSAIPSVYGVGRDFERAVGPINDPNYFGLFVVTGLLIALHRLSVGPLWQRIATAGAAAVISISVVVSFSRGALFAAAFGIIILAFSRSKQVGIATIILGGLVVATAYPAFSESRFELTNPTARHAASVAIVGASDQARLAAGAASLKLFARDPIFGIGFGQYHFVSPLYLAGGQTSYAHNWYANVLAEQGALGISLVVLASMLIVARLWWAPPSRRSLALSVLGAYAVGCIFTEAPSHFPTSAIAWLVVGAALARPAPGEAETRQSRSRAAPIAAVRSHVRFADVVSKDVAGNPVPRIQH